MLIMKTATLNTPDTCSYKKLAQESCIKNSCRFMYKKFSQQSTSNMADNNNDADDASHKQPNNQTL